jgi:hypothetical protein
MEFIQELEGRPVSGLSQTYGVGLIQRYGLSMS